MAITKNQVEKWNSHFKSLSKAEQRVEIAKDIIQSLKNGKYIANVGSYIVMNKDVDSELDVRSNFNQIENCECCALGACLLSTTKYKNTLNFGDVKSVGSYESDKWNLLKTVFTEKQIATLEYMFESSNGGSKVAEDSFNYYLNEEDIDKCDKFYYKHDNDENRLKAICQNIIDNKGNIKI